MIGHKKKPRLIILLPADGIAHVPLSRGQTAVIDIEDVDKVSGWCWSARIRPKTIYAFRKDPAGAGSILLHRVVMGAKPSDPIIDHKDGDGLNNRKSNLRFATMSQNLCNMRRAPPKSGFRGVYPEHLASKIKWTAKLMARGKRITVGCFDTQEEAARAYDLAALEHHGEFARTNF